MALRALAIIVALEVNGAEKPGHLQVAAFDEPLACSRLKRSVELVHDRLEDRLEQPAGGLENQGPELLLEDQQALVARRLIEELLDISGGFLLERLLDLVPFFLNQRRPRFGSWRRSPPRIAALIFQTPCGLQ
jgi:hypothetical protein